MYSLGMNHEVFVSKVNSWNIHVAMFHNICSYFAATLKWDVSLGEASPSQLYFVLFVALWKGAVGSAQNYFWTCTEHLLFVERGVLRWEILVLIFVHLQIQKYKSLHWVFSLSCWSHQCQEWRLSTWVGSGGEEGWWGGVCFTLQQHSRVEVQKTAYFLNLFFSVDMVI